MIKKDSRWAGHLVSIEDSRMSKHVIFKQLADVKYRVDCP